jgi:hypothetical protein
VKEGCAIEVGKGGRTKSRSTKEERDNPWRGKCGEQKEMGAEREK